MIYSWIEGELLNHGRMIQFDVKGLDLRVVMLVENLFLELSSSPFPK